MTISQIIEFVREKMAKVKTDVRVLFDGRKLKDDETLWDLAIKQDDHLEVVIELLKLAYMSPL